MNQKVFVTAGDAGIGLEIVKLFLNMGKGREIIKMNLSTK